MLSHKFVASNFVLINAKGKPEYESRTSVYLDVVTVIFPHCWHLFCFSRRCVFSWKLWSSVERGFQYEVSNIHCGNLGFPSTPARETHVCYSRLVTSFTICTCQPTSVQPAAPIDDERPKKTTWSPTVSTTETPFPGSIKGNTRWYIPARAMPTFGPFQYFKIISLPIPHK